MSSKGQFKSTPIRVEANLNHDLKKIDNDIMLNYEK